MLLLSSTLLLLLHLVDALVPTPGSGASTLPGSNFAPNVSTLGAPAWTTSILRARQFVSQLTLPEKINLTTGIDIFGPCVGNTGSVPRIGFQGFCLQDSPLGVRLTDGVSAFPTGINVAMTWDKNLIQQRGAAMGAEFRGRGVNVALGPMMNMGRVAPGGRNWEGFGGDPFLAGVAASLTVQGIQSQGVIACAKHFVGNEQEHMRGGSGASETAQTYSSEISTRTLREVYVWPFQEAIHAGVGAVMCAYNRVNDQWACESDLLGHVLKEELDFKGLIVSDWAALVSGIPPALASVDLNMPGFMGYGIGPQDEEDPAVATNSFWGAALIDSVNNGSVPEWRVDDMVTRTMTSFFQMGQDKNFPAISTGENPSNPSVQGNHATLIRQIGAASAVLLKQTSKSPLPFNARNKKLPKTIAVLGSDAGPNPDGPNGCENGNTDRGCSQGTLAMGWGSGTAQFPYLIDPLAALTSWFQSNSPSTKISSSLNDFDLATAASLAGANELTMVFANSDSGEGYINVDGNQGDRNNLTLWHGGDALIEAATSQSSNVVVVIHAVGPVVLEAWINNPNITAVVWAGLPGQESGNGLVDVLSGAVNPSGRLPYTIAKNANDYPAGIVFNPAFPSQVVVPIPYTEGLEIDYKWFDAKGITPRFEFGFGLSYTTFQYSGLSISKAGGIFKRDDLDLGISIHEVELQAVPNHNQKPPPLPSSLFPKPTINPHPPPPPFPIPTIPSPGGSLGGNSLLFNTALQVEFNVKNTGGVDGNEVAQVYLGYPNGSGEPPKVLRGFEKVDVRNGQSERVEIGLRMWDLTIWDESRGTWVIPSGNFQVFVGASSRDIRLTGGFNVARDVVIPASG